MALSQIYSAVPGHVITAARWNNEFGNIYSNGTDVAFPVTKAVSLAGFTLTVDAAGVSSISSTASTGFALTVGAKAGAPGANGSLAYLTASTFTDTSTAAAGTATLWTGFSIRTPTLAATNANVTTTDAATVYIEGPPTAGSNQTITRGHALLIGSGGTSQFGGDQTIAVEDTRTNTVDAPLTVRSTTSGTPDVGIGTGILLQAESQDEVPSNVGQVEFAFSDITTASEDSYFQVLLRVAGAALSAAYRFVATSAFRAIFTHANTADRTYTLPNRSMTFGAGELYSGPTSTASGSTAAHEGTVTISANQALDGTHFYTDFTLDAAKTVTLGDNSERLVIIASGTITINGIIDGVGAGSTGGAGGSEGGSGTAGASGSSQVGGGGGAGAGATGAGAAGGGVTWHGSLRASGAAGGATAGANGSAGTTLDNEDAFLDRSVMGGAGGGGGGSAGVGATAGSGGRGGGSVVLIAPTIVLGVDSEIKTTGVTHTAGNNSSSGGGGGGGGGHIIMHCNSFTDNGCAFSVAGGAGGASGGTGGDGGNGAAGVRQINIYA